MDGGASGVDDVGMYGHPGTAQQLQGDRGILSSANGDQYPFFLRGPGTGSLQGPGAIRLRLALRLRLTLQLRLALHIAYNLHEIILASFPYLIHIKELAQAVIIQVPPPFHLVLVQETSFHDYPWRTCNLPVTHQFHHAQ